MNAGHNWPVLRRPSGEIERLQIGGLPLGIMPHARYECGSTSLAGGDLLVIFTDGLVEAEDGKEQEFGEPRMLGILNTVAGKSAGEVLSQLMASVDTFVGVARQHDDMTCMVVRRCDKGECSATGLMIDCERFYLQRSESVLQSS